MKAYSISNLNEKGKNTLESIPVTRPWRGILVDGSG